MPTNRHNNIDDRDDNLASIPSAERRVYSTPIVPPTGFQQHTFPGFPQKILQRLNKHRRLLRSIHSSLPVQQMSGGGKINSSAIVQFANQAICIVARQHASQCRVAAKKEDLPE